MVIWQDAGENTLKKTWGWREDAVGKVPTLPHEDLKSNLQPLLKSGTVVCCDLCISLVSLEIETRESLTAYGPTSLSCTAPKSQRPCVKQGGRIRIKTVLRPTQEHLVTTAHLKQFQLVLKFISLK